MHIFVGSTNPVKLNAVTIAASETWPELIVQGFEVKSGVSNQPMTDQETKEGAKNRANSALQAGLKNFSENDECIAIGMEGGVFENESGELWNTVWACVVDQSGVEMFANGERFHLPQVLAKEIRNGKEMGPAMDEIAGTSNIKHQEGMIGIITKKFIDRTEMYAGLAKLALGLWYGKDWQSQIK